MPKFREITGQFVGYVPDGTDPDVNPDREAMNGRVTFTPVFTGGVIAFPELSPPEFAHPEPISARIIDGFVQVQVGTDDDVSMQPLSLMVTVDDEATQTWSWRAEFTNMRIGAGEVEVTIPSWSFRVPDGTGPVDLTELVPLKSSGTVDVTKGPRGAGLENITAVDGQLVFAYTDGEETTVPIPEAVQGPQGEPGPAGADGAQGPEGPQGPAGEIPDLLVGNIADATPTGKNLMLAATEGAARNALGLQAGATATNGALEELNAGTSSTPRVWTASNLTSHMYSNYERKYGVRGNTRTIYVRETGSDSNDGTSASQAFREIRTAVDTLSLDGPVVRGSVVIDVGAGTYKGGIRMPQTRGTSQDDYIIVRGPSVGGHPNAPTAIIDSGAEAGNRWGILAEDGSTIWLQDLKFIGAFPNAVRVERGVFMQWRNVHVDGQGTGTNGASIQHHCRYVILGGIVQNLTGVGILELFNCTRSFGTATSNATQMIIRNCNIGLQAKEGGVGHLDWLNVEDCGTGVQLNGLCVANVKGLSLKRNTVGLANVNSEVHNAQSVTYGYGDDSNARGYIAIGSAATDLTDLGWTGDTYAYTTKAGAGALTTLAASYTDATVAGTTSETDFYNLQSVIPMQRYNVTGRKVRIVAWGSVDAVPSTSAGFRVLLRFGTSFMGEAKIPMSAAVGDDFKVEFEVVCSADGNNQKVMASVSGWPPVPTNYATRSFNFTNQAGPVAVRLTGIPGDTAEGVTMRMIEVSG